MPMTTDQIKEASALVERIESLEAMTQSGNLVLAHNGTPIIRLLGKTKVGEDFDYFLRGWFEKQLNSAISELEQQLANLNK